MTDHDLHVPAVETDAVGPRDPREEIRDLLRTDESRLGDIYRWREQGLSAVEMKGLVGGNGAFVYSYLKILDAAFDAAPVAGPTLRRQVLSALNGLIRKARNAQLSADAVRLLVANRAAVEAAGSTEDAVAEVAAEAEEREEAKKTLADLEGVPGIYAFS